VKRSFLAAFMVLLPLLVACASGTASGGTPAAPATQELTVKAQDTLKFDPTALSARAGQPIQLTLDSSGGQLVHDFSITEGVSQPIAITSQPGQKATGTFTLDKPGTYTYFCSQPGHEQAGMKGTLTLQ
jgi:plastocyanin